jgi:nucleoid DNA-binding protein
MTKAEVIREVAKEASITKWAAEPAVNQIRDIIVAEVKNTGRFAMEASGCSPQSGQPDRSESADRQP